MIVSKDPVNLSFSFYGYDLVSILFSYACAGLYSWCFSWGMLERSDSSYHTMPPEPIIPESTPTAHRTHT